MNDDTKTVSEPVVENISTPVSMPEDKKTPGVEEQPPAVVTSHKTIAQEDYDKLVKENEEMKQRAASLEPLAKNYQTLRDDEGAVRALNAYYNTSQDLNDGDEIVTKDELRAHAKAMDEKIQQALNSDTILSEQRINQAFNKASTLKGYEDIKAYRDLIYDYYEINPDTKLNILDVHKHLKNIESKSPRFLQENAKIQEQENIKSSLASETNGVVGVSTIQGNDYSVAACLKRAEEELARRGIKVE